MLVPAIGASAQLTDSCEMVVSAVVPGSVVLSAWCEVVPVLYHPYQLLERSSCVAVCYSAGCGWFLC